MSLVSRNTRQGIPTRILMNLSVSLLMLTIVLYVTELLGDVRRGCVVSNVLRYYFVMASLLWNGAEGLNMYLMLVKVFDSHIHHFTLKAGLVAWGEQTNKQTNKQRHNERTEKNKDRPTEIEKQKQR